jgi:N-succinyldiaminopimelate aminotransferase
MSPAKRVAGLGATIFTEMSALAVRTGAINLGQGFPDTDGPASVIAAAVAALRGGHNQYAPLPGVPALREAVFEHQRSWYGLDPEDVLITFGATEAIASALLGLCDPGDEVVVLEPYYDSYAACIAFAGATRCPVTLRPPGFEVGADALRAAIGSRARVLLLNTPHNPTGRVLGRDELALIAAACVEHDLICVTDEVYEHLVYDGEHIPVATLPGMASRTLTISSVGKSFSVTGWKIGWCSGPAELVAAARMVKQFLTFAGGTPLQHAAAVALRLPRAEVEAIRDDLRVKRDQLCSGLEAADLHPITPAGTYFVNADVGIDEVEFCRELPQKCGIVAIPTSVFYDDPSAAATLVRFAFCKRPEVIAEAARRLADLHRAGKDRAADASV